MTQWNLWGGSWAAWQNHLAERFTTRIHHLPPKPGGLAGKERGSSYQILYSHFPTHPHVCWPRDSCDEDVLIANLPTARCKDSLEKCARALPSSCVTAKYLIYGLFSGTHTEANITCYWKIINLGKDPPLSAWNLLVFWYSRKFVGHKVPITKGNFLWREPSQYQIHIEQCPMWKLVNGFSEVHYINHTTFINTFSHSSKQFSSMSGWLSLIILSAN